MCRRESRRVCKCNKTSHYTNRITSKNVFKILEIVQSYNFTRSVNKFDSLISCWHKQYFMKEQLSKDNQFFKRRRSVFLKTSILHRFDSIWSIRVKIDALNDAIWFEQRNRLDNANSQKIFDHNIIEISVNMIR